MWAGLKRVNRNEWNKLHMSVAEAPGWKILSSVFFFFFLFVFYFILSLLNTSVPCPSVKSKINSTAVPPPTCKPGQVNSTFYNVNITQMCLHFTCTSQDTASCGGLADSIRHLGELCVFSQGQRELDLSGSRNCPLCHWMNLTCWQTPRRCGTRPWEVKCTYSRWADV